MADLKKAFKTWQQVAGDSGDPWESEDDAMFLFEMLPHTGAGLEKICEGHPHGEEVLARLQEFFRDAAVDSGDGGSEFEPQRVPKKSDAEIQQLLLARSAALREIAVLCADDPDNDDMVLGAGNPPQLVRVHSSDEIEEDQDLQILFASDLQILFEEKVAQSDADDNPLFALTEALYHSAGCWYAVANYVLWPIVKGKSTLDDPYRPGYELWLQGVIHKYAGNGVVQYTVESD